MNQGEKWMHPGLTPAIKLSSLILAVAFGSLKEWLREASVILGAPTWKTDGGHTDCGLSPALYCSTGYSTYNTVPYIGESVITIADSLSAVRGTMKYTVSQFIQP